MAEMETRWGYYIFENGKPPRWSDTVPPDIEIVALSTRRSDIKPFSLEGEDALKFFDASGSGWIREEIFPETLSRWRRLWNKLRFWK